MFKFEKIKQPPMLPSSKKFLFGGSHPILRSGAALQFTYFFKKRIYFYIILGMGLVRGSGKGREKGTGEGDGDGEGDGEEDGGRGQGKGKGDGGRDWEMG